MARQIIILIFVMELSDYVALAKYLLVKIDNTGQASHLIDLKQGVSVPNIVSKLKVNDKGKENLTNTLEMIEHPRSLTFKEFNTALRAPSYPVNGADYVEKPG